MDLQAAETLALKLMAEFGLLPGWAFRWDNARKRFGRCSFTAKEISLSRHLTKMNHRHHVEDTIRHEIAHAKDAEERGRSDHSPHWKKWAIKCGAKPSRCYSGSDVKTPEAPLYTYCPNCNIYSPRYRKIKNGRIYACGQCSRGFNPDYLIIPNIPLALKKKMETGEVNWYDLTQSSKIADHLGKQGADSLFVQRFRDKKKVSTPNPGYGKQRN